MLPAILLKPTPTGIRQVIARQCFRCRLTVHYDGLIGFQVAALVFQDSVHILVFLDCCTSGWGFLSYNILP
jgi:hypothetical protein